MRHSSCRLACHDMFSDMLFNDTSRSVATTSVMTTSVTMSSVLPNASDESRDKVVRPQDARDYQECVDVSSASCIIWWAAVIGGIISLLTSLTLSILYFGHRRAINRSRGEKYEYANPDIQGVINQVERAIATLKCEGGSDQLEGENDAGLVQGLQNQLTELSQVLKHRNRVRGSVAALSSIAVLESNNISTALSRDFSASQKKMNDFV